MGCCNSGNGCCNSGSGCCKSQVNTISQEEYDTLKSYLESEIKDFNLINYTNSEDKVCVGAEVEFEDYVLEIDEIDKENCALDNIIDIIIKNHMI